MSGSYTSEEGTTGAVIHARTLRDAIVDQNDPEAPGVGAAIERATAGGEHLVLAILRNAIAMAYRETARAGPAVDAADQALSAARLAQVDDLADAARLAEAVDEEVRAHTTLAMARLELGDFPRARADLERARAAGPLDPLLAVAGAAVARHAGEVRLAVTLLEGVVADQSVGGVTRIKALNNLADVVMASRPALAIALLEQAEPLAASVNPVYGPVIRANRGIARAYAGDLPAALADLRAAEGAMAHLHTGVLGAELEGEFARVLGQLRLLSEARASAGRSLAGLTGAGTELVRADALMGAGRLAAADGDREAARGLLTQAYGMYAEQGRPAGMAIASIEALALSDELDAASVAGHAAALAGMGLERDAARGLLTAGELADRAGDLELAEACWARAASLSGADPVMLFEARARSAIAEGADARADIDAALALIDERAAIATAPDLRHRIGADRVRFELLARAGRDAAADEELDDVLRGRPAASVGLARAAAAIDGEELRLQWRELARRVDSADEDPARLIALGAQLADTERALRASAWAGGTSGGTGRRPMGLDALPSGMPILTIARVGDDAVAWSRDAATRPQDGPARWQADPAGGGDDDTVAAMTGAARPGDAGAPPNSAGAPGVRRVVLGSWRRVVADLDQLGRALARIAAGSGNPPLVSGSRQLAADLDEAVAGLLPSAPAGTQAAANPELLLILDRGLEAAPWAALPSLWGRPVTMTSLAVTRAEPGSGHRARESAVTIATGPRLTHGHAEAEGVAAVWGGARRVASAPSLLAALATDTVVHLAAHATFRWDNALQSVVHLADGPLALGEVVDVARARSAAGDPIQLVYFAACSLASAPVDLALPGAVTTLTEHGVESVIASSIPLPDAQSRWIAHTVHAAVCRGDTPAAGLAQARAQVEPGDPDQAVAWAALACLSAHTALP